MSNLTKEECVTCLNYEKNISPTVKKCFEMLIEEHFNDELINYYKAVMEDRSFSMLFDVYAFEDDDKLSEGAIKLKNELLNILDKYSPIHNPPLDFEEIDGQPIYDKECCCWYLLSDTTEKITMNGKNIEHFIYVTNIDGEHLKIKFEKGRFYAKKVKED